VAKLRPFILDINVAGIYIHIPFCRKACHYCNFHFSTTLHRRGEMLAAMQREITLAAVHQPETIQTLYFGGGTPSLLFEEELIGLMGCIRESFNISESAEVTLEANPDDIRPETVDSWIKLGINRLSIGIQSFREEDLRWMNRAHDAEQAFNCIGIAQSAGIRNLSIDLIYGTPGLSDDGWRENMRIATSLDIPHISCYALTVETGTALEKMIRRKKMEAPVSESQADQFHMAIDFLGSTGYEHYEISNFARPGMRSRHNSAYWQGTRYTGIGPSAHSFDGRDRRWNLPNNAGYIRALQEGYIPFEAETLTDMQRLNEYVMTSIRTIEGLNLTYVEQIWGNLEADRILREAQKFIDGGKMYMNIRSLILTREGKLFADGVAAELFG
jgi:oxygen-independent coproporphyrinogen-3 oxidase